MIRPEARGRWWSVATGRAALLLTALSAATVVAGEGAADPLLKLVPADAGLTVAVEDLRGHAREFLASPLADGLRRLPAVARWRESPGVVELRRSLGQVEALLGADLATVRDEVLGEAVVLSLWVPPGRNPDAARGMLLVRVADRALLDRLVDGLVAADAKDDSLRRGVDRSYGGVSYRVREFAPGQRDDEYYAKIDEHVFAWSNSEALIRGAIDRRSASAGGLAGLGPFAETRRGLPSRAAVSLFLNPRFLERVLEQVPDSEKPEQRRLLGALSQYVAALTYAGAALEWRDGFVVHTHEVLDPARVPPALKRWAEAGSSFDRALARVPATALAVAQGGVDALGAFDLFRDLLPDNDRERFDAFLVAFQGLLMGVDLRGGVLPNLGPGVTAYLDRPDGPSPARLPLVVAARFAPGTDGAKAASAVDNALKTLLAFHALDPKHGEGRLKLVTRPAAGATVVSLDAETPYAYAVHNDRLVMATSAGLVAHALETPAAGAAPGRFDSLRERWFPGASNFACVDLNALHEFADGHRPGLSQRLATRQNRPVSETSADLGCALELIRLFDAVYLTSKAAPNLKSVHRAFGLVAAGRRP